MPPVTRPRRPHPARVYWVRRLLVLVVALGLVWGVARLLGSGSDPQDDASARTVGADASAAATTPTATTAAPAPTLAATPGPKKKKGVSATPTPVVLATPSGPCIDSDVVVDPAVKGAAYAGRSVVFSMTLSTRLSPACTFDVSASTVVVRLTSGADRIWSTQQCAGSVPKQSVTVRNNHPVSVSVVWNGQRSDADCSRATKWAEPGFYHVTAAVLGADPVDKQFELQDAVPATITATPTPTAKPSSKNSASPSGSPSKKR